MTALAIDRLTKRYDGTAVVNAVSLEVAEGEFVSLLGPSGCGKTTILRMIAGLLEPSSGRILFGDSDVTRLPPNRRNVGLVFQSYALFPHLTVFDNVAFGLRRQKVAGRELARRVGEALERVRLGPHAQRFPRQLSGGQQQRVALARSIAPRPAILLFDEPLSNLDAQLREEMQIEIKRLQADLRLTSLFVTHDQHEAMSLSDRICLMSGGDIQQFGTPEEVYFNPANGFVSGFVGSPNQLTGTAEEVWRFVTEINLMTTLRACRHLAPGMRDRGHGRIVNMASDAALSGDLRLADYAAAKAGIIGFTRALARELAPHGVTVNAVCPGAIATAAHDRIPRQTLDALVAATPAGFIATPEEVAGLVAYLASDEARFVTGQTIAINGGRNML